MAASEGTIQNKSSKSRKFSRETSEPEFRYMVQLLALRFPLILLINLKLIIS